MSGYPSYEGIPEQFLASVPIDTIIDALNESDTAVLDGGVRLVARRMEFPKESWIGARQTLPASLSDVPCLTVRRTVETKINAPSPKGLYLSRYVPLVSASTRRAKRHLEGVLERAADAAMRVSPK